MGKCPYCGVANDWKVCPKCGEVHCNACGKNSHGVKRSAANVCPYCKKTIDGAKIVQKAPAWAK